MEHGPSAHGSRAVCRGWSSQREGYASRWRVRRSMASVSRRVPALLAENVADVASLQRDQLADAGVGEIQQAIERLAAKRHRLRRSLQLDVLAGARLDDVHVHVSL